MTTTVPCRIQLRRSKGWRKPADAVVVSRPSVFGNPFLVAEFGQDRAVELFEVWLLEGAHPIGFDRAWMRERRLNVLRGLPRLAGKRVACWCPLEACCHGTVLLKLANRPHNFAGVSINEILGLSHPDFNGRPAPFNGSQWAGPNLFV